MVDGLDNDDIYIMVEDELLSVAQSFTQHLHHAEYVRLKNLAKSQNASAIKDISSPTDSRVKMREELKKKKVAEARATKQSAILDALGAKEGTDKLADMDSELDDDTDNEPWTGTSLQGLMTGSRRSKQSLTNITGAKSGTRAAAGFARTRVKASPERAIQSAVSIHGYNDRRHLPSVAEERLSETDDEDDDDLDIPVSRRIFKRAPIAMNSTSDRKVVLLSRSDASPTRIGKQYNEPDKVRIKSESNSVLSRVETTLPSSKSAKSDLPTPTDSQHSSIKTEDDSLLDHIPKPSVLSGYVARRIQQRLADMKAKQEQEDSDKTKVVSINEIPSFELDEHSPVSSLHRMVYTRGCNDHNMTKSHEEWR